jgi:hypothetical protein
VFRKSAPAPIAVLKLLIVASEREETNRCVVCPASEA